MDIGQVVLVVMLVLLGAWLIEPVAKRMRLPFMAALVLVGFVGSEVTVRLGGDVGLRWHHFHDLVLHLLLPVLIFQAALGLELRDVGRNLIAVVILAIPVMLVSAVIIAALVYWGIGSPSGFPWLAALLTGALLAATDPATILAQLRRIKAPVRLATLLEGESLFNDATAVVLFMLLIAIATGERAELGFASATGRFFVMLIGGAGAGLVVAVIAVLLLRTKPGTVALGSLTVMACFFSFFLAQFALQSSGVMAVLTCGIILGRSLKQLRRLQDFVAPLWRFNAYVANVLVFVLVGVTITVDMFSERWLAMLIAICAAIVARAVAIYWVLPALLWMVRVAPLAPNTRAVLFLGGQRGAVTLALALALPVELEAWWTVQSIAYGVVVFGLFVQAPLLPGAVQGRDFEQ